MINISVSLLKTSKKWNDFPLKSIEIKRLTKDLFNKVLETLNINTKNKFEIEIELVDDKKIRELNKEYRGKDKETNVLSFPLFENEALKEIIKYPFIALGDVVISIETLERESIEQNIDLKYHFAHLLLHSILHLLGYDHIEDKDAEIMEGLEEKILKNFYKI